ncbi:MAG TPA: hypothetical protein V6D05_11420 [Stenomitos sp.]
MIDLTSHFCAQLLLERGLLSADQITSALRIHMEQPSLRLTDALLLFGFLSFSSLHSVLREVHHDQPIGRVLVEKGRLSAERFEEALGIQEQDGGELVDILSERGWCCREVFGWAQAIAEKRQVRRERWAALMQRLLPAPLAAS